MNAVLRRWLPLADVLLDMVIVHLPSPTTAQPYRTELLYAGPQTDEVAAAMRECRVDGPLMVLVAAMVPCSDRGQLFALGRVFSGVVRAGQHVHVLGSRYRPGDTRAASRSDFFRGVPLGNICVISGRQIHPIVGGTCGPGNIVLISGVSTQLSGAGTLTTAGPPLELEHGATAAGSGNRNESLRSSSDEVSATTLRYDLFFVCFVCFVCVVCLFVLCLCWLCSFSFFFALFQFPFVNLPFVIGVPLCCNSAVGQQRVGLDDCFAR